MKPVAIPRKRSQLVTRTEANYGLTNASGLTIPGVARLKRETKHVSEQMQGEIANLNAQIDQIDDPREGFAMVKARINELRTAGRDVPAELIRLEKNLQTECICQSRGG
jgi:septal ring factor EnvC (AmiA/AmiB activator)